MRSGPTYKMAFRRRREEKTNYKKRIASLKGGMARFVIRKSLAGVKIGVMEYNPVGDVTKSHCSSAELKKFGWKLHTSNIPASYLTGLLAGKKAQKEKVTEGIADIGLVTPVHGGKVFACIKGIKDSGVGIKCDESAFPSDERISGKHIEAFAGSLSGEEFNKQFSGYLKNNLDPKKFSSYFTETMEKIKGMK